MIVRVLRSTWVRVLLSAAILWWLAARIDMAEAARAIVSIRLPHLVAVLALVGLDRVIMIHRWVLLLRASGVPITTRKAADIFLVSSFVGSFLPAGVGADMARAYSLRSHTRLQTSAEANAGGEALASVVVDRLLGTLSLGLMGVVGLLAWTSDAASDWRVVAIIAILVFVSVGAFWADHAVKAVLADRAHASRIGRALLRVTDAVSRYRGRGTTLAAVFFWSVAIQVIRIVEAYLLGLGLGLAVPFSYYLLFMPLGLLMLLLPISVSGFGLPQGVFVWLLRPVGVPDHTAFALSTLIVLTGLAGNIPGLLLWLRQDREIL
ncbi:MAG: flippase-like domain-containing protein [Acidobacteria bacterium]|nr:flippase-like domain-containing protein [Acidobacteriota bacterium]